MEFKTYNKVTPKIVSELINLDADNFLGNDVGNFDTCINWLKVCPEMYTIIKHEKKTIGYINFLPITKQCFEQVKLGRKKDYEILPADILNFKVGDNYCLFMSLVIDKKYRFSKVLIYLFKTFKKKINNLNKKGIIIKSVVADCVTPEGEKLAYHFNGKYVGKTLSNSKIFEFKFNL